MKAFTLSRIGLYLGMMALLLHLCLIEAGAQNFYKKTKYNGSGKDTTPEFKGYLESSFGLVAPLSNFIENQRNGYIQPVIGVGGTFEFGYMTKKRIGVILVIQQDWLVDNENNFDFWYFESCQIGPYYSHYISEKLDLDVKAAVGISDLFYYFQNDLILFDGFMWRADAKLKFYFARKWGWTHQIGYTQSNMDEIDGLNGINYRTVSYYTGILFRFK